MSFFDKSFSGLNVVVECSELIVTLFTDVEPHEQNVNAQQGSQLSEENAQTSMSARNTMAFATTKSTA